MTQRARILIVDDNELLGNNLCDIFNSAGYNAELALDGGQAIAACLANRFDLGLIDIKLPDISGDILVGRLRELLPDIAFIMMTGNASLETAIKAVEEEGVVAYETKPLDFDRLMSLSREVVSRKRAESALRLSQRTLEIANSHNAIKPLLNEFCKEVRGFTGCECVGLRVLNTDGSIPYVSYVGFEEEFYLKESPLSIHSDECMCIYCIRGETDPEKPFFTKYGSFFLNGTTRFLSTISEDEKGATRNECNRNGYETVALIPFKSVERILGLIHVADRREEMMPSETVKVIERCALQLGAAIQRILAEDALKESEEKYRLLFENAAEGIAYFNEDKILVDVNPRILTTTGLDRDIVTGMSFSEIAAMMLAPDDPNLKGVEALLSESPPDNMEVETKNLRGEDIVLNVHPSVVKSASRTVGYSLIVEDITTRKRYERELLESKLYAENLIKTANVLVVTLDLEGNIIDINDAAERILGYRRGELAGKRWLKKIAPQEKYVQIFERYKMLVESGEDVENETFENPVITNDGKECFISWRTGYVKEKRKIIGIIAFGIDITERKKSEEKIRALSQKVFEMQEEERSRLSRELHDELGQQLTALRLELEWVKRQPGENIGEESFAMLIGMVESSMAEVRRICRGLRPTILDDLGLGAAMESLSREFAMMGIFELEYKSVHIEQYEISPETAICVFRVLQEALNNVAKHSAARKVTVDFRRYNNDFILEVSDDGRGFSNETLVGKQGFGIIGMGERAALCGGAMEIKSEPGKGTHVIMKVPARTAQEV